MIMMIQSVTQSPSDTWIVITGSAGWNGWRVSQGQRGEVLKEWDWDGGVLLIHIVEAPEDGGTVDRKTSLAFA